MWPGQFGGGDGSWTDDDGSCFCTKPAVEFCFLPIDKDC